MPNEKLISLYCRGCFSFWVCYLKSCTPYSSRFWFIFFCQTLPWLSRREVGLLKELWDMIDLVESSMAAWRTTSWREINVEEMELQCKRFSREIRSLDKEVREGGTRKKWLTAKWTVSKCHLACRQVWIVRIYLTHPFGKGPRDRARRWEEGDWRHFLSNTIKAKLRVSAEPPCLTKLLLSHSALKSVVNQEKSSVLLLFSSFNVRMSPILIAAAFVYSSGFLLGLL